MKKNTKNMLIGAGIATAGIVTTTTAIHLLTKNLVKVALERDGATKLTQSKTVKKRISGLKDNQEFFDALKNGEEKLRGYETETVEITSYDGTALIGHFYPCENPKRIIVAMHGWRSGWDQDFGMIAPFLRQEGCSVLYAEQRGQNGSGGTHITFGLLERYDCLDWVSWVSTHTLPGLPVYLAGISMGATTVLMAAGLELPPCVKGIAADCGFTSPHSIWKHVAERNLHLNYDLHHSWAERLFRRRLHMHAEDVSTLSAMEKCRVPVLFIHGSDDSFVPVEMTYENYKACAAPKELLIVPGAGHGLSYLTEPERYQQSLHAFWGKYDG